MRNVINGNGQDSTAAVKDYLASHQQLTLANLYLIGELEDPRSFWLTDWESPLTWPVWGTFQPAVIKRGQVTSKIGLEVDELEITWTPSLGAFTQDVVTADPRQLVHMGWFDNRKLRLWRVFMPIPGDASTFGGMELFGGWIYDATVDRGTINLKVHSFLNVLDAKVPPNVIESTNILANFQGAVPPHGMSRIPQFAVIAGSGELTIIADCTSPSAHKIFNENALAGGYLVFNAGSTLQGMWGAIASNKKVTISEVDYNQITLYASLPWPPTPGTDTFYVSGPPTVDRARWQANTNYALGAMIIDSNGNYQEVTTAGVSAASEPTWSASGTTADGTVTWAYVGTAPSSPFFGFPYVPMPESQI